MVSISLKIGKRLQVVAAIQKAQKYQLIIQANEKTCKLCGYVVFIYKDRAEAGVMYIINLLDQTVYKHNSCILMGIIISVVERT